jgi:hypothetical protein
MPAGDFAASVVASPDGASVYVANAGSGSVSQYSVGAGGALTPMSPSSVAAGSSRSELRSARTAGRSTSPMKAATTSRSTTSGQEGCSRPKTLPRWQAVASRAVWPSRRSRAPAFALSPRTSSLPVGSS